MKSITKRYLLFFGVTWSCSAAILIGIYLFMLLPQKTILNYITQKVNLKESEYNRLKSADIDELKKISTEKMTEAENKINYFTTDVADLDTVTFNISNLADELGIVGFASRKADSDSYNIIPNCKYLGRAEMMVNFTASFNMLAKFINSLERSKPVVFVESFSITKPSSDQLQNKVSMILSVLIKVPSSDDSS